MAKLLLACAVWLCAGMSLAEEVAVALPNVAKSYIVTTDGRGGALSSLWPEWFGWASRTQARTRSPCRPRPRQPYRVRDADPKVDPGGARQGGTKTTGAGLSEIYSRTAAGVADGSIPLDKSYQAIRDTTKALLAIQGEADQWAAWDKDIDEAITIWRAQSKPSAHFVTVYREVASGTNRATGYKGQVAAYQADKGIFDGINIEQIIKLIELIMKLLTLFGK